MVGFDKESVDVIKPPIRCFGDQRARPTLKDPAMLNLPLDDRIADNANAMGVCNSNRTFEKATFLDPRGTCHFTIPVKRKPGCKHRVMILLSTWVDDSDTCPCRFTFDN